MTQILMASLFKLRPCNEFSTSVNHIYKSSETTTSQQALKLHWFWHVLPDLMGVVALLLSAFLLITECHNSNRLGYWTLGLPLDVNYSTNLGRSVKCSTATATRSMIINVSVSPNPADSFTNWNNSKHLLRFVSMITKTIDIIWSWKK